MPPPSDRFLRSVTELAPDDTAVYALEIAHPDLAVPVRVVHDTREHVIETHAYAPVAFRLRLAADTEGEIPRAEIAIDNVGRELTQWIDASGGGAGATVRIMQVLAATAAVEWEVTFDVLDLSIGQAEVVARLGYDPLLTQPAVVARWDPSTAPSLF